jgi:glycerate dehydrogenase
MKLVITDGYCENPGDLSWEPLKQFGELVIYDRTEDDEDKIIDRIGDADIAIINKVPITERIMDACPNLKAIAILATGYNVVDIDAAKRRGIPVCNVPAYGTDAVA